MKEPISSLQNPTVKQLVKLREKPAERQKQGLFIIEGHREIALAREAGVPFQRLFHCPELTGVPQPAALTGLAQSTDLHFTSPGGGYPAGVSAQPAGGLSQPANGGGQPAGASAQPAAIDENILQEVTRAVFEKIAYRESTGGLLALAEYRPLRLEDLRLSENPLLIILEAVEKPGNLGAILRTADAAGADAVIVCDPRTDLCNPNVIRSSLGCVFTTQVVAASSDDTLRFLNARNIPSFAAALTATRHYHETDLTGPAAIVMGTESTGLTEKWLQAAGTQIKIPMHGRIDSLNVSTACAILTFEAVRQRQN